MKKRLNLIIVLLIGMLSVFFVNVTSVSAATNYTCSYTLRLPDSVPGSTKAFKFSIVADPSSGKIQKNIDGGQFMSDYPGYSVALDSSFNKFVEQAKTAESGCPAAYAVNEGGQFNIKIGNFTPSAETVGLTSTCLDTDGGNYCSTTKSDGTDKKVVYCTRTKPSRNNEFYWTFEFYTINNTKMFSAKTSKSGAAVSDKVTGGVGVDNIHVQVDSSTASALFANPSACSQVEFYLSCSSEDNITITNQKPSDGNNCGYVNAEIDDGKDDDGTGNPTGTSDKTDSSLAKISNALQICDENENPKVVASFRLVGIFVTIIKIIAPIIIIVMGMFDMSKAVLEGKDDSIKKQAISLLRRAIACVLIFFVPTIIRSLFHFIDGWDDVENEYSTCIDCILGDSSCPDVGFNTGIINTPQIGDEAIKGHNGMPSDVELNMYKNQ